MDSKEDLMRMLGLDKAPKAASPAKPIKSKPIPAETLLPDSALKLDEWDRERGKEIHKPWEKAAGIDEVAMADFFATAYQEEPHAHDCCQDELRLTFVESLLELPDNKVLREMSRGNLTISGMTAESFAKEFKKLRDKAKKIKDDGKLSESKKAKRVERECFKAACNAVTEALDTAEEMESVAHAMGMGAGTAGSPLDAERLAELYNKVKNNPHLRQICDLAGRMRRCLRSRQRQKTSHGYDDMVGIKCDDDISRLLDEEVLLLVDDDFGLESMRRFAEKESLAYDFRGVEYVGKGPIIVTVDTSGSMGVRNREPVNKAKALALTMAWLAKHQKRPCVLCNYSGSMHKPNYLVLPASGWDDKLLCEWLLDFEGRGSNLDVPVTHLPVDYPLFKLPKGKTDLIMVTDAVCYIDSNTKNKFNKWKEEEKVRCISLVLGRDGGSLKDVSDEMYMVKDIDSNEDGVTKCFSI